MTTQREHWATHISTLRADVAHLLAIRAVDRGLMEMVSHTPAIGRESEFWSVYHLMYSTTIATGLRRIIFPSGASVCLLSLFRDMAKSESRPSEITRAHLAEDTKQLLALGTIVKKHVDVYIAHIHPAPTAVQVRWKDLSTALDLCSAVTLKYSNLLTKERFGDLTPVLSDEWRAIFRIPWLRESSGG